MAFFVSRSLAAGKVHEGGDESERDSTEKAWKM